MISINTLKFIIYVCILNLIFSFQSSRIFKSKLSMHFDEAINGNKLLNSNSLKPDRYLATNRFKVRPNKEAKFEKRWADRKSRLSQLEGFRLFSLFRKIESQSEISKLTPSCISKTSSSEQNKQDTFNYISFTIWKNKDNFDAWRTGEAFKEAHGGGSILDFMKLIGTALFIIDGSPKPAFYDCLLYKPCITEETAAMTAPYISKDGWRSIVADGENILKPEVFLTQYKFNVPTQKVEFEKQMTSELNEIETSGSSSTSGLLVSTLLRRDADKADDNYEYILNMIWANKEAYMKYLASTSSSSTCLGSSAANLSFYEGKLTLINNEEFDASNNSLISKSSTISSTNERVLQ